ncbi:glucuronate isomerase [Vibrio agarivorans]|uniref:glucuronate isomerase n=1 Tax=Vibrio agarivorans TaxID=153622 RepID=UPI0025B29429|nr:glucuronate isomerase [Vibrio agarivorans]MDN3660690.1 glucuronate isomerase [Vibrio agarivorans]
MEHKNYIHDNFLLTSELAQQLYHCYAADLPIIDYHNHLDAKDIWQDTQYDNLAEAWLYSDHYVWRAMRSNGINEHFITGDAPDNDKFTQWCEAMPYLLGNPLYQWSHLELKRFFDCDLLLNPQNAKTIWQHCNEQLKAGKNTTRQVLKNLKVQTLCTTDSPLSHLQYHAALAESDFDVQVLPTFRADELFVFDDSQALNTLTERLQTLTTIPSNTFANFVAAIEARIENFHRLGCRLSDLGLTTVDFAPCDRQEVERLFFKAQQNQALTEYEVVQLKTRLFIELGQRYHKYGWSMQIHIGVLVNVNQRRKQALGGGTGFSVINDRLIAENLAQLLSALDAEQTLPNTVLYNLNPNHNAILSCMAGAFQDSDGSAGKIQFGAAWWFNDHKDGMEAQLTTLKNLGALGRFVGMLTDSRNIFSFSRHEYFRRVLCNLLAKWVEEGEIPHDESLLKQTIENICYKNAERYFNFNQSAQLGE